jgi:hypothetical protein
MTGCVLTFYLTTMLALLPLAINCIWVEWNSSLVFCG